MAGVILQAAAAPFLAHVQDATEKALHSKPLRLHQPRQAGASRANNRGGALGGVGTPEAGFAYGGHSGGQVGKAPGRKKRYRTGVSGGYDTASQTSLYSPVAFANLTATE